MCTVYFIYTFFQLVLRFEYLFLRVKQVDVILFKIERNQMSLPELFSSVTLNCFFNIGFFISSVDRKSKQYVDQLPCLIMQEQVEYFYYDRSTYCIFNRHIVRIFLWFVVITYLFPAILCCMIICNHVQKAIITIFIIRKIN